MSRVDQTALDACDSEPIHIPGATQGFGCLIAFEKGMGRITAISANCLDFLGNSPMDYLNKPIMDMFDKNMLHNLGNKLGYSTIATRREFFGTVSQEADGVQGQEFDAFAHAGKKFDYIEIVAKAEPNLSLQARIAMLSKGLQEPSSLSRIMEQATSQVKQITKSDRVMFYRFLPDDSGEVVAEECDKHMEPYLGLRFPAWDIPKQARELYASTPIRTISDVNEAQVPLIIASGFSASDFDLSAAALRATSPIHCEYLSNMGVASTMTVPIVIEGRLWGVISCHNESARTPEMAVLDAAEIVGYVTSYAIAQSLQMSSAQLRLGLTDITNGFIALQTQNQTPKEFLEGLVQVGQEYLNFDGVGILIGDEWTFSGSAPGKIDPERLVSFNADLVSKAGQSLSQIAFSNDAAEVLSDWGGAQLTGFLDIPISNSPNTRCIFFRKSVSTQITWAGSPQKDIQEEQSTPRISPRKSFKKYIDEHGNRSEEWIASDIQFALALQSECASSQSAARTIMQQKDRLRILAD